MKREQRYKLLAVLADGKNHNWFEIVNIGVRYLKVHQYTFEKLFKTAMENGLIKRVDTPLVEHLRLEPSYVITWEMFDYALTLKGDQCFRGEQLSRGGEYDYYSYFDRTTTGNYGLDRFSPLPNGLSREQLQKEGESL